LNEKFYKILGWLLVLEAGSWCYSPFCEALQHIHLMVLLPGYEAKKIFCLLCFAMERNHFCSAF
jgi:hypothetical protein